MSTKRNLQKKFTTKLPPSPVSGNGGAVLKDDKRMDKYTALDPLRDFLKSGDVALVRASHLLSLPSGGKFLRRQDLPPEAAVDDAMLDRSFAELEAWHMWLQTAQSGGRRRLFHLLMRFPPFVVVSYAWSAPQHPDADGRQLREVFAPALKWYMCERAKLIRDGGHLDSPRIPNTFDLDGCDFCIFLDYSSMYQHSPDSHECESCKKSKKGPCELHRRSAAEEDSFKRALRSMDLLYAHQHTCVWRMTRRLDGQSGLEYKDRGWPTFETSVSWLITHGPNCLDLGTERARKLLRPSKQGVLRRLLGSSRRLPPHSECRAEQLADLASYESFEEPGIHGLLQDSRRPPTVPADFEREMEDKILTNGKDKEVVIKLQREVATVVLSNVETLNFSSLGWSAGDAKCLAKALPHCWRLKSLNVTDNALGRAGAEILAEVIAANCVLIALDLTQNAIGSDGAAAIAKALAANRVLTSLSLACNKIGVDGASAIAAAVEANGTLTNLNLDVNKIGPKGAAALVKALEVGGGTLTTLSMNGTCLGDQGATEIAKALGVLTTLHLEWNYIGNSGAAALAQALRLNGKLTTLDLTSNCIGAKGAIAISKALELDRLMAALYLSHNRIGDEGATGIARALEFNGVLTELRLCRNSIGPKGATAIAKALEVNRKLTTLDLRNNTFAKEMMHLLRPCAERLSFKLTF